MGFMQKKKGTAWFLTAFCCAFALLAALLLAGGLPVQAAEQIGTNVTFGYKSGDMIQRKWMPVTVDIRNFGEDTIEGTLKLSFYYDDADSSAVCAVCTDIVVPGKTTKTYTLYVRLSSESYYNISISDQKDRAIYSTQRKSLRFVQLNAGSAGSVAGCTLIGVLSDQPEMLQYLNSLMQIDPVYTQNRSIAVEMIPPERFPEREEVMADFDLLIIDGFDLSASSLLSDRQKEVLHYYIQTGGFVLAGTGSNAGRMVSAFSEYFADAAYAVGESTQETVTVNVTNIRKYLKYAGWSFEDGVILPTPDESMAAPGEVTGEAEIYTLSSLDFRNLADENFSAVQCFGDNGYLYANKNFNLYLLSWELGAGSFRIWSNAYLQVFDILYTHTGKFVRPDTGSGTYGNYASLLEALLPMEENNPPSIGVIAAIILLYLALVSPVAYMILKKKQKRELLWAVAPVLVILCAIAVFGYGYVSKSGGNVVNSATVVELNPYSSLKNPARSAVCTLTARGGEYRTEIGSAENGVLYGNAFTDWLPAGYYYYGQQTESAKIHIQGAASCAVAPNASMWSISSATASYIPAQNYGSLQIVPDFSEAESAGRFSVTITNQTGYSLRDIAVVYRTYHHAIDQLAPGESVTLSDIPSGIKQTAAASDLIEQLIPALYPEFTSSYQYYSPSRSYGYLYSVQQPAIETVVRANTMYTVLNSILNEADAYDFYVFAVAEGDALRVRLNGSAPNKQLHHTVVYQHMDTSLYATEKRESELKPTEPVALQVLQARLVKNLSASCTYQEENPYAPKSGNPAALLEENGVCFYELCLPEALLKGKDLRIRLLTANDSGSAVPMELAFVIPETGQTLRMEAADTDFTLLSISDYLYLSREFSVDSLFPDGPVGQNGNPYFQESAVPQPCRYFLICIEKPEAYAEMPVKLYDVVYALW